MKTIIFEGRELVVIDETAKYYICPPDNAGEGLHFVRKSKAHLDESPE